MLTPQELRQIEAIINKAFEVGKDELMNTKQCAKWLGISEKALRKRCDNGTIPHHKKHGFLYFRRNEIAEYYTRDGQ
jgi:hypothetical protein